MPEQPEAPETREPEARGESGGVPELVEAFFSRASIVHTVSCFLKGTLEYHSDPMTHLVITLCREPLCICLTDRGLAPVRSDPSIVMPYAQMTQPQLACLLRVAAVWRMSAAYGTTTQMGGGVCVYDQPAGRARVFVDAVLLFYSVTRLVRSCDSTPLMSAKTLSNVMLQRIVSSVNLPREVIARAERMLLEAPAGAPCPI